MRITGHVKYTDEETHTYGAETYTNTVTRTANINYYRSKSEAREIRATHGTSDWTEVDLDGHFTGTFDGEYKSCTSSLFKI